MSYLEMSEEEIHKLYQEDPNTRVLYDLYVEVSDELNRNQMSTDSVITYILGKGYMESPLEFLRCWNEGNFEALREEWPDAPEEIYLADPLYKGKV